MVAVFALLGAVIIAAQNGNFPLGGGVTTVNTLTGAVTLAAGTNITITPAGNTLTIASTGGSGITGLTTGFLPKAASSTTIANSLCDEGITTAGVFTCAEPITSTSAISSGAPCTPAGLTAVGGVCLKEATATGWTSTAGFDYLRADSTLHAFVCGMNAAAESNCTFGPLTAPTYTTNGTTATFMDFAQGTTSAAVAPCNTANSKCFQAPVALTANVETLAPATAQGIFAVTGSAATTQEMYSGDANHSATVTTGSGASIGSTSLCSTVNCPVGTYVVHVYIDITTACTTTGTYVVNLIYTDDQGSKTVPVNINGTGAVPATGVLTLSSTANFGENSQVIRSTGAASINYSTTAGACGTGGPMVGKLYLAAVPVM